MVCYAKCCASIIMGPSEKFNNCLHTLRIYYQILNQDIFDNKKSRCSLGFLVFLAFMATTISACIYTILNYDDLTAFSSMITVIGVIQVREQSKKNWGRLTFTPNLFVQVMRF